MDGGIHVDILSLTAALAFGSFSDPFTDPIATQSLSLFVGPSQGKRLGLLLPFIYCPVGFGGQQAPHLL